MLKKNKHRGDTTASAAETASTTTSSPSAPQSTPQHDVFIIAINFGTMYSSVAWVSIKTSFTASLFLNYSLEVAWFYKFYAKPPIQTTMN